MGWFVLCVFTQIHGDSPKGELITKAINIAIVIVIFSIVLKIYNRWRLPRVSVAHLFLTLLSIMFGYGFYMVTEQFGVYAFSLAVIGITSFNFLQSLGLTATYDFKNRTSKSDSDYILKFWSEFDRTKKIIFSIYGTIFHAIGATFLYFSYFHLKLINTSPVEADSTRTAEMLYKSKVFYVTPENLQKLNFLESFVFIAMPLTILAGFIVFWKLGIANKQLNRD